MDSRLWDSTFRATSRRATATGARSCQKSRLCGWPSSTSEASRGCSQRLTESITIRMLVSHSACLRQPAASYLPITMAPASDWFWRMMRLQWRMMMANSWRRKRIAGKQRERRGKFVWRSGMWSKMCYGRDWKYWDGVWVGTLVMGLYFRVGFNWR